MAVTYCLIGLGYKGKAVYRGNECHCSARKNVLRSLIGAIDRYSSQYKISVSNQR
jgi:hypothetical protein